MRIKSLLAPLALLVLTSCASTAPTITSSTINDSRNNGTLLQLYEEVRDNRGSAKNLKPQNRLELLQQIESAISEDLTKRIQQNLILSRNEQQLVSLSIIDEQQQLIQQSRYVSATTVEQLRQQLAQESQKTQAVITQLRQQVQPAANLSFSERYQLLKQLTQLSNQTDRATLNNQVAQLSEQMTTRAQLLFQENQVAEAFQLFRELNQLAPETSGAAQYQQLINGGLQQKLLQLIAEGEPLAAYNTIKILTELGLLQKNDENVENLGLLSQYFAAMSNQAVEQDELANAYDSLQKSRFVSSLIQDHLEPTSAEAAFVESIFARYQVALRQNEYELALGYLSVIETMRPDFPDLQRLKQQTLDVIRDAAIKKVSVTAFSSFSDRTAVGNTLAAKITEYLFNYLPNDVRVVEREHLDAVLREQEISALNRNTQLNLASADLLIQGSVVEANVETSSTSGRQTQRVVTGYDKVANPAHAEWSKLSRSNRNKTPEPATFLEIPKEEDISIGITNYRKIAILGVSYRVVDANSATVLFAESLNERELQTDDSREGMQLGTFSVEFKNAELPSDSEMMNILTERLAARVGEQVSELLKGQEALFLRDAQRLELEQNFLEANRQFARSYAIATSKQMNTLSLEEKIRTNALKVNL